MERLEKLAKTIINYSLETKKDENILITSETTIPNPLIKELVKQITQKEANVVVKYTEPTIENLVLKSTKETKLELLKKIDEFEVNNFDSFIKIRCNQNDYELSDVDSFITKNINKSLEKTHDIRVNERKWVLLNYPSNIDAYKAKKPFDNYYNYALDVMCYDYKQMEEDLKPLKELMEKTDKVRLTGKNTDITFSIKNMPIIPCTGKMNIPDGEIYCAPVKDSVNGTIKYNTPSPYRGNVYTGVTLTLKDGKIIEAKCDNKQDDEKLQEIFNSDEGARYIGEFSIGVNPLVKNPMGDILYDEKIIGSIHFTPGMAYKDSFNGNTSVIHWDMVLIQREEYGGGDIYFDDILIRKNGIFISKELEHLNK